jgi:hypothetical protein
MRVKYQNYSFDFIEVDAWTAESGHVVWLGGNACKPDI